MPDIFIYTILNHYTKRETLDPGYLLLDNSSNERPDWFEYWPIRKFLLNQQLNEDAFYGFISPRFKEKTNLGPTAVYDFIRANDTADIVIMTPSLHLTAYYWNVFHYGEACHPGLLPLATDFLARIGQPTNLVDLVTNSQNEIYSNYIFAKPRFWRAWLEIIEQLIAIAESPSDDLGARLRTLTSYRGENNVQMKIFVMERIPTWMLTRSPEFVVAVRDPFVVRSRIYKVPGAIICDALKVAYVASGRAGQYKDVFVLVSRFGKVVSALMRIGNYLGLQNIRSTVSKLSSYWTPPGRS